MTFAEQLRKMRACLPAVEWVGASTLEQAWRDCERADWMLWLLRELRIDTRRCAGLFALRVWHLVAEDARLAAAWAIDCALRSAERDECDAAYAADAAAYAAYAAAYAAAFGAAAYAADAAAYAAYAAYAAAYAAAANAATDDDDAAAERRAQCAIIREEIPLSLVRAALNRRLA